MQLLGIGLIAWGAIMTMVPYLGWYLEIGWKLRDAEPSRAALVMNRIGGVVCMAIGFGIALG